MPSQAVSETLRAAQINPLDGVQAVTGIIVAVVSVSLTTFEKVLNLQHFTLPWFVGVAHGLEGVLVDLLRLPVQNCLF